jgi:hypothetical protein
MISFDDEGLQKKGFSSFLAVSNWNMLPLCIEYQSISHLIFCHNKYRAESKKIFVGGLSTEVTEKDFADYFGTFGVVKVP